MKYIVMDFCREFNLKKKTAEQQLLRLKIKPLGKERIAKGQLCNVYDDSAYEAMKAYNERQKNKPPRKVAVKKDSEKTYYRVSVKEADAFGRYHYYMRHFGLSKRKADELVRNYRMIGLSAAAIPCIFKEDKVRK